ncbi:OXYGENASE [Mycoplasmopsis pulmonis]|uniref:OXYGENASE n=1 Tax=Mycoplasmopsis pulmonis (strain UAB CTIP) TaxID=272635 RepID=Q98QC6_MYCPU|nr:MsnO8 family LLM class oxidoreductase [Mycoplasmopsis pulmonis]CAC13613.1 OXYGENASE [Mycoplasmopsis pulmonis]
MEKNKIKLSVLDFVLLDENQDYEQAFKNTIKLAKLAEKLGYQSYWLGEHHGVPTLSNSVPELTMLKLAQETKKIKIGSAGIMLRHYSATKAAEITSTLELFYPGRFLISFGSHKGTVAVQKALNSLEYYENDDYLQKVRDYQKMVSKQPHIIELIPSLKKPLDTYLLSTSVEKALFAGENNLKLIQGPGIHGEDQITQKAIELYYKNNKNTKAEVLLSFFVLIDEDAKKVEKYKKTAEVYLNGKDEFQEFRFFPSYESIKHYSKEKQDYLDVSNFDNKVIYGNSKEVREKILNLSKKFKVDHFLIIPLVYGSKNRENSLKLLKKAFEQKLGDYYEKICKLFNCWKRK